MHCAATARACTASCLMLGPCSAWQRQGAAPARVWHLASLAHTVMLRCCKHSGADDRFDRQRSSCAACQSGLCVDAQACLNEVMACRVNLSLMCICISRSA